MAKSSKIAIYLIKMLQLQRPPDPVPAGLCPWTPQRDFRLPDPLFYPSTGSTSESWLPPGYNDGLRFRRGR